MWVVVGILIGDVTAGADRHGVPISFGGSAHGHRGLGFSVANSCHQLRRIGIAGREGTSQHVSGGLDRLGRLLVVFRARLRRLEALPSQIFRAP